MMSALTRKLDEARRLLELYTIYKDSPEAWRRRKAHVDLDRFLMENRETAIMCIERVLQDELDALIESKRVAPQPWLKRLAYKLQRRGAEGGVTNDGTQIQSDEITRNA